MFGGAQIFNHEEWGDQKSEEIFSSLIAYCLCEKEKLGSCVLPTPHHVSPRLFPCQQHQSLLVLKLLNAVPSVVRWSLTGLQMTILCMDLKKSPQAFFCHWG